MYTKGFSKQDFKVGLDSNLAQNWQQAIIWTNDDYAYNDYAYNLPQWVYITIA